MRQWVIKAAQIAAVLLLTWNSLANGPADQEARIIPILLLNIVVVAFLTAMIWSLSGWVQRKLGRNRGIGA